MDIELFCVGCCPHCGANLVVCKVRNVYGHILLGHRNRRQRSDTSMLIGDFLFKEENWSWFTRFSMLMNHLPPMFERIYRKICDVVHTGLSVDSTWQKRGFPLYNGAVAAISITTRKIRDRGNVTFLSGFKVRHNKRSRNHHDGSAPKMEVTGVKRIFGRLIKKK